MRSSILFKILLAMTLFNTTTIFSQEKSFTAIIKTLQQQQKIEKKILTSVLEDTYKLQDIRYKDSVDLVLEKFDLVYSKQSEDKRIHFLNKLISSRNKLFNHEYLKAIDHAMKALELKENGTPSEIIYLYTTLGSTNYFKSNYVEALEWHLKALKLCKNEKDNSCLASIYNNLAIVYFGTEDIDKIEGYTLAAYHIADSTGNLLEKSRAAGNMAIVFAEQGKFDESEQWFLKDLEIDFELKDSLSVARNYNNLGRLFEYKKDFKKSLAFYRKGLEMAEKINDQASVALGYQNVGWLEHRNGNNVKAESFFKIGMKQTKELGNLDKLRDAYFNISEFYENTNRLQESLKFLKKYNTLNDSLVGEKHLNAISELEVKYETEKKENELLKLSKEKQKNELVIAKRNRQISQLSFAIGAVALFGLLAFFLFKQRLQNKKQEELLLAISETQTEERRRIAQDLHDSIGGSLALTKSKFETVKNKLNGSPKEIDNALRTLEQTTNQVRQISHNLMPGELVRFGLVAAINTLLESLNEEEINAQFNSNQDDERLDALKEIQLYRIVQEALQNVLKHAKAQNLFIQLNKRDSKLSLMIEDDGTGIVNSETDGMGLKNIRQRVKLLKGVFTMDSSPEKGTILNIQIPM